MKIFGHPMSTCTRKVMMTLAEKGQEAEFVPVDVLGGEHRTEGYRARQPFGVVPVLDDEGFVLYESRAIIRYIDGRFGTTALTPTAPRDAARMNQWLSVDQPYVAPHTRTLAVERIVQKHARRDRGRPAGRARRRGRTPEDARSRRSPAPKRALSRR